MERIIWSQLPFAIYEIHNLCFRMRTIYASSYKRFPMIICQVTITMSKSSYFCFLDSISIKSEFKMNRILKTNREYLQMAFFCWKKAETEQYLLYFKFISVARTIKKVKIQCTNSFYIATINSTNLNNKKITFSWF